MFEAVVVIKLVVVQFFESVSEFCVSVFSLQIFLSVKSMFLWFCWYMLMLLNYIKLLTATKSQQSSPLNLTA
jgi:hypothetical protein